MNSNDLFLRRIGCCLFSAVLLLVASPEVVRGATRSQDIEPKKQADWRRAFPLIATAKVTVPLPVPISPSDLERYATMMDLSTGQKQYLNSLHEGYIARCKAIEQEVAPSMTALAQSLAEQQAHAPVKYPDYTDTELAFLRWAQQLCTGLERADQQLFDELQQVLADVQRPMLQRAQLHRERSRRVPHYHCKIRKAMVDLSKWVDEGRLDNAAMRDVDPLLWEYEQAVTPPMTRLESALRECEIKRLPLMASANIDERGNPWDKTDPAIRSKVYEIWYSSSAAVLRKPVDLQKQIARINDEYLPKIIEKLPAAAARHLQTQYFSYCYDQVYPDPSDPEPIYQRLLTSPRLAKDLQEAMEENWLHFRREYDDLCSQMRQETDRWQELGASTEQAREFSHDHNQKMLALSEARANRSESFMRSLAALLSATITNSNQAMFQDWSKSLAKQREEFRRRAEMDRVEY